MATANLIPPTSVSAPSPFANEPFVDFTKPENKRRMEQAIADLQDELGHEYDIIIGGKHIKTEGKILSFNPAHPAQVIGVHQRAAAEHVETPPPTSPPRARAPAGQR